MVKQTCKSTRDFQSYYSELHTSRKFVHVTIRDHIEMFRVKDTALRVPGAFKSVAPSRCHQPVQCNVSAGFLKSSNLQSGEMDDKPLHGGEGFNHWPMAATTHEAWRISVLQHAR